VSDPSETDPDRTLPLFPLATVVLFPGVDCPLHVFEPRYRQMTRDARAGAGRIGMVTVRPEHTGDMAGDPPVFPIGCMGRLSRSEDLPDGRINVVLHGTTRFRIRAEPARPPEQLYRTARVEELAEAPSDPAEVARQRERVAAAFGRLVQGVAPERAERIGPQRIADLDDPAFVAVLMQILNLPPVERQTLLETNGVGERLRALESILAFQLAQLGLRDAGGSDRVH